MNTTTDTQLRSIAEHDQLEAARGDILAGLAARAAYMGEYYQQLLANKVPRPIAKEMLMDVHNMVWARTLWPDAPVSMG